MPQLLKQINTILCKEVVEVKPKEQKLITIEAPFIEEISGMAITKLLDKKSHIAITLKLKFIRNRATLKVTNSTEGKVTFNPDHVVGIVDLKIIRVLQDKAGSVTTKSKSLSLRIC